MAGGVRKSQPELSENCPGTGQGNRGRRLSAQEDHGCTECRERYEQLQQILSEGIFGRRVIPESYEAALEEVWRQEYRELPIYELVDVPLRAALREERSRIAQDLHDSVIQDLLGVQMQLRTLKYTDAMEEIREGLQLADTSLSHIQKELREILVSVKPEIVETLGLKAAFLRHFRFMEASYQITVDFQENIGDRRFGSDIETVVRQMPANMPGRNWS